MSGIDLKTPLTKAQRRRVTAARQKAWILYEGVKTPHRSCGIAIAETFDLATPPYQALRKGGLTGHGECGAIVAGRLVLGELLGDPDPSAPATEALKHAATAYESLWRQRIDRQRAPGRDVICRTLTQQFPIFGGPERAQFCTHLAAEAATCVAEVLVRMGESLEITPVAGVKDFEPRIPEDPAPRFGRPGSAPTMSSSLGGSALALVFYALSDNESAPSPQSPRFVARFLSGSARDFQVKATTRVPAEDFEDLAWRIRDRGDISAPAYEELDRLERWLAEHEPFTVAYQLETQDDAT